jgi:hypothetical protein
MMLTMSKKIHAARKDLTKALKKHADTVGTRSFSLKKAQRAAAAVQVACLAYAKAVHKETGLDSPFADAPVVGLEAVTIASLEAERDALSTRPVEIQPVGASIGSAEVHQPSIETSSFAWSAAPRSTLEATPASLTATDAPSTVDGN